MRKVLTLLVLALLASGCGVFTNPQTTPTPPALPPRSETGLAVTLRDFGDYVGEQVDMRYVGGDGTVLGVYRFASLHIGDYRLELISVPRKPDSYVDILVDSDGNGTFEPASEPAWSKPLNASGSVLFAGTDPATGAPQPAEPGGDFVMHFTGFGHLQGRLLRVLLANPANQTTGLYTGAVEGDEFSIVLPQVVVASQPYRIALYADANGNGEYDAPPADAAWRAYATGEASGISLVFPYNEDFEDIDLEQ